MEWRSIDVRLADVGERGESMALARHTPERPPPVAPRSVPTPLRQVLFVILKNDSRQQCAQPPSYAARLSARVQPVTATELYHFAEMAPPIVRELQRAQTQTAVEGNTQR